MYEKNLKGKGKMDVAKAINQLSNVLSMKSKARQQIQSIIGDSSVQKIQSIHQSTLDIQEAKEFLKTEFNRDPKHRECYRSPYTNQYFPAAEDGSYPSPILRDLQEKGNILFQEYAKLYYGADNCISNFYVYESEQGLNVEFVLKKQYKDEQMKGVWCSSCIFQIRGDPLKSVTYKLQSTIVYELQIGLQNQKDLVKISGILRKNKVEAKKLMQDFQIDEFHLLVCGKMVQETQTLLRQQLQSVFIAKCHQTICKNRSIQTKETQKNKIKLGKQIFDMRKESSKVVD